VPEICTLHVIIINMGLCPSVCQYPTLVTAGNSVPAKANTRLSSWRVCNPRIHYLLTTTIFLYRPDGSSPDTPSL